MLGHSKTTTATLLLDGATWLKFILGNTTLPTNIRDSIEESCSKGKVYVSVASIWQVSQYISQGVLDINKPTKTWLEEAINASGVQVIDIDTDVILEESRLPSSFQTLPWHERMLVASAKILGAKLLTNSNKMDTQLGIISTNISATY